MASYSCQVAAQILCTQNNRYALDPSPHNPTPAMQPSKPPKLRVSQPKHHPMPHQLYTYPGLSPTPIPYLENSPLNVSSNPVSFIVP